MRPTRAQASAARLVRQIVGAWRTQALRAAVQLGFPEQLAATPQTADELADATGCHADSTARLLRALCVLGVCRELVSGHFRLTRSGRLLCADGGGEGVSLKPLVDWWGGPLWPVWADLAYSVQTGASARELQTGAQHYGHIEHDAEMALIFHQAMRSMTALITADVANWTGWKNIRTVVDVGGGHGELLIALLRTHTHLSGEIVDRHTGRDGAEQAIRDAGLTTRLRFCGGDFFEAVPGGADCYILKSILHNWDDARCTDILARCRAAVPDHAFLLVIERVRPTRMREGEHDEGVARTDLNMLAGLGGRERTFDEYRALLDAAGFGRLCHTSTGFEFSLIEAYPLT